MGCQSSAVVPPAGAPPGIGGQTACGSKVALKPKLKRALTLEKGMGDDMSCDEDSIVSVRSVDSSEDGGDSPYPAGYVVLQSPSPWKSSGRRLGSGSGSECGSLPGIQAISMKGQKADSPNQDSWIVVRTGTGYSIYGVFDGHGKAGHDVSHFVKSTLPNIILDDPRLGTPSQMVQVMTESFAKMAEQIVQANRSGKLKAQKSGTTATVVVHDHAKRMLTISHVGDSGCAIASGSNWKAKYLTPDHKPNLPNESKRIYQASGAIMFDGHNYRIHKKGAYGPQLNMSRSFGDLWGHDIGLTSVPDTVQVKISSSDHLIVLCSDGVWEYLSAQDAVDNLRQNLQRSNPDNAAHELGCAASDQWSEHNESGTIDDITVLLVKLQEQPGCSPEKGKFLKRSESTVSDASETGIRAFLKRSDSKASIGSNGSPSPRVKTSSQEGAPSPKGKPALRRVDSNVSCASNADGSHWPKVRSALKRSATQECGPNPPSPAPPSSPPGGAGRPRDTFAGDRAQRPEAMRPAADGDFSVDVSFVESSPKVSPSIRHRSMERYFYLPEHNNL